MSTRPIGKLRIIGGQWRSRLFEFEASIDQGLRATPDRVRQTLFDWLSPIIAGAECLDLFAGSGALGLEALSRGAGQVTFVDRGARQTLLIRAALLLLKAEGGEVLQAQDAIAHLQRSAQNYDVVFLDPPFGSDLLARALAALPPRLKPGNRIFLEWPGEKAPELPAGFEWLRQKQAGQVSFGLVTYAGEPS